MHKQKTAEQERRSMRLLMTGEFKAAEKYFVGNAQALKQLEIIDPLSYSARTRRNNVDAHG